MEGQSKFRVVTEFQGIPERVVESYLRSKTTAPLVDLIQQVWNPLQDFWGLPPADQRMVRRIGRMMPHQEMRDLCSRDSRFVNPT